MRKGNPLKTASILFFSLVFSSPLGWAASVLDLAGGPAIFVSKATGSNKNPGTRSKPLKNLDKAIKKASSGAVILVAEGVYSGTFDIGYFESDKPLKLYGGFNADFSQRDPVKYPTLLQPDNASGAKSRKPILKFTKAIDGAVVDGFIFDMGRRNSYDPAKGKPSGVDTGMLLLPPQKASGEKPTVTESCLAIPSAAGGGDITITNNAFLNCAKFGIQAGLRSGKMRILNNVFVADRMAAIEVYGTCRQTGGPGSATKCGDTEIAFNTILFSWSRTKDFLDMGYGIRIMTKMGYDIHNNIISASITAGIDHSRYNSDDWIRLDKNVFFANRKGDLHYSPQSNTILDLQASQFEDLEFAHVSDNQNALPKGLPVDKTYLEGFLAARYSEKTDLDRDSPANQWRSALGLNLQGKISSSVSMFANRYPAEEALKLFGAVEGKGAQGF